MSKGSLEAVRPRRKHDVFAIVLSLVLPFVSLTKAWLFFLAAPALLIALPLLFVVRSRAEQLRVLGRSSPRSVGLARAQLIGLLVAYGCLPGFGDTSDCLLFGFLWVDLKSPLVTAMWYCSIAGAVMAVISTIAFQGLWRKTQPL